MSTKTEIEPVRKSISIEAPPEHAFTTFTEGIARWWPLGEYSVGAGRDGVHAETVVLEGRAGGRLYERMSDGQEADWGEVLVWEPPSRVVLTWHPGQDDSQATEIELRFAPEGEGTRLEFEHRAWERLGEGASAARTGYDSGWDGVLGDYAAAASTR